MAQAPGGSVSLIGCWVLGVGCSAFLLPRAFLSPSGGKAGFKLRVRMKFSLPIAALLLCTALACAETPAELALKPYTLPTAPDARAWPRARLVGFMTELADFVEKNHIVSDPS